MNSYCNKGEQIDLKNTILEKADQTNVTKRSCFQILSVSHVYVMHSMHRYFEAYTGTTVDAGEIRKNHFSLY